MKGLRIEKATLNVGTGTDQSLLEKGMKLLNSLTNAKPVKTVTHKRIPSWGARPGLPVGCKVTVRKDAAVELIDRILDAKSHTLTENNFDETGTVSIGIPEYIDIKGMNYDPDIGIMGLQICITLERPGFRVKRRKLRSAKISGSHKISREEAMEYMKSKFNVKIGEEE
ncbi:MAG: 50S ribosomal protein L5 [Candidatus Woesearchaeota archaeon]